MLPSGGAPSVALSESQANFALGACQSVVQGDDDAGVLTLKYNNLLPEYFLCGHHDFFLEALCNPQMLELHARLLGENVGPDDPAVRDTWALWEAVRAGGGTPERAWAVVISALLQAPERSLY